MVCVPEGYEYPEPPKTLTERVAWALCAHDTNGNEGRLTELELRALEALIAAVQRAYASPKALSEFMGPGAAPAFQALRRFALDERHMHTPTYEAPIFMAHVIRADWPSFMGPAEAAVAVLMERPEAIEPVPRTRG